MPMCSFQRVLSRRQAVRLLTGFGVGSVSLVAACAPIEPAGVAKPTAAPAKPTAAPAEATKPSAASQPAAPAAKPAESKPAEGKPAAAPPAGPAGASAPTAAPQRAVKTGGTLTIAAQSDVINFDAHALPAANRPIFQQIFSPLIRYDANLKPQPELAESWEVSPDSLTITMKLRKGVTFHSGRDFTAEDVLWNLKRLQDPAVAANSRVLATAIKDAQALDPHTVRFGFERPTPGIFDLFDLFYVMDREVTDVKSQGAGTGPFKVAAWNPGDQLRMVRHDGYFKPGLPRLNEIVVKAVPDAAGRIVNLESGAVDLVLQPLNNDFTRLKQAGKFQTPSGADGNVVLDFIMNVSQKPFDDRRVRQAFNLAVDRQRVLDRVYSGVGELACIPFPKHSFAYDQASASSCRFDLDGAKKLLTEAGYGDGIDVEAILDSSQAAWRQFAEIYQSDLAKIGVRMKLTVQEPPQYRQNTFNHRFQCAFHNFGRANKDPDGLFRIAVAWYPTPEGFSTFTSPEYARLVGEAGSTMDQAKRKELYAQIMKLIVEESFVLSIVSLPQIWAVAPQVRELAWNLDGHEILEGVWLDT
jgi:peptide/nickel transport system substrate-binding protein